MEAFVPHPERAVMRFAPLGAAAEGSGGDSRWNGGGGAADTRVPREAVMAELHAVVAALTARVDRLEAVCPEIATDGRG